MVRISSPTRRSPTGKLQRPSATTRWSPGLRPASAPTRRTSISTTTPAPKTICPGSTTTSKARPQILSRRRVAVNPAADYWASSKLGLRITYGFARQYRQPEAEHGLGATRGLRAGEGFRHHRPAVRTPAVRNQLVRQRPFSRDLDRQQCQRVGSILL